MPIRVHLIRENGSEKSSASTDPGLLEKLAEDDDYRLLRYIDPYGDTYFNQLQMDDLLQDLKRSATFASTNAQQAFLLEVEQLALTCLSGTHLYLKFLGD